MPPLQTRGQRIERRTKEDLNHFPDGTPFSASTLVSLRRRGNEWTCFPPPPLSKRELLMRLFAVGSFQDEDGVSFIINLVLQILVLGEWLPIGWMSEAWPKTDQGILLPVPELKCVRDWSLVRKCKLTRYLDRFIKAGTLDHTLFMQIANLVLRIKRSDAQHARDVAEQDAQNEESFIQRRFSKTDEEDDISYNRLLRYS